MTDTENTQVGPQAVPEAPARLRWDVPVWVALNSVLASIPLIALGQPELLLYTLLPALLLTVILLLVPQHAARKATLIASLILVVLATTSVLVAGSPIATVISIAVVVFLASLPPKPAFAGLGNFMALAFLVYAWLGTPILASSNASILVIAGTTLLSCGITSVVFILVTGLLGRLKPTQAAQLEHAGVESDTNVLSLTDILGPTNPMFRYAVVRAVAIGVTLTLTSAVTTDGSGFWILLAQLLVGQPTGQGAWKKAVQRVVATLIGVLVFFAAFALLPEQYLILLAFVILLVGLAWVQRNRLVVTACATVLVIVLAGLAQSDYTDWAMARIIDTAIGAAIGVGVSFVGESRRSD